MMRSGWGIVETASRLLECSEREVVLGDLVEGHESSYQATLSVLGLFLRRQIALWKEWQSWLAGFGVALPNGYLLIHVSLSVTCTYQRLANHKIFYDKYWPTGHEGFLLLLCHIVLLIAWSWTGGYVVGSLSRRTLWASACLAVTPAMLCLVGCVFEPLSAGMFLFVVPGIFGVHWRWRNARISLRAALAVAVLVTVLMLLAWSNKALWVYNWALIWPTWFLVVSAWRTEQQVRTADRARYAKVS